MADVFISYSRRDRALAQALACDLTANGCSVWWDFELVGGEDFRDAILRELNGATAVIVIWTANSVASAFVRDEADHAAADNKLIPTRAEGFNVREIPLGLRQLQTEALCDREGIFRALKRKSVRSLASNIPNKANTIKRTSNANKKRAKAVDSVVFTADNSTDTLDINVISNLNSSKSTFPQIKRENNENFTYRLKKLPSKPEEIMEMLGVIFTTTLFEGYVLASFSFLIWACAGGHWSNSAILLTSSSICLIVVASDVFLFQQFVGADIAPTIHWSASAPSGIVAIGSIAELAFGVQRGGNIGIIIWMSSGVYLAWIRRKECGYAEIIAYIILLIILAVLLLE